MFPSVHHASNGPAAPPQFVTVKLSRSSVEWLKKARMNVPEAEAARLAAIDAYNQERETGVTKFTLFKKLPLELKDKIWGFYVLTEPRIVDIVLGPGTENLTGWDRNRGVVLRQIDRYTRAESILTHGYVNLQHPKNPYNTWIYNPSIDMLLLSHIYLSENGLDIKTASQILEQGGVIDKVKFVVLDAPPSEHLAWMASFKKFSALEVILMVVRQYNTYIGYGTEGKKFWGKNFWGRPLGAYDGGYMGVDHLGNKFRLEILRRKSPDRFWESFRDTRAPFKEAVARGPERTIPVILFVGYVWICDP